MATGLHGLTIVLLGVGVGLGGYGAGALTGRAGVAAALFAACLVGLGGWPWAVPGVVFFGGSSALSYLPSDGPYALAGPPQRTLRQVLANGGVAWLLLGASALVAHEGLRALGYAGFLGALSAAAADTWATELGTRYGGRPVSLRTLGLARPGQSGAVSFLGTLAGGAGAAVVAAGALPTPGLMLSTSDVSLCALAGAGGMLADSLAGAALQGQYTLPRTEGLSETRRRGAPLVRGWEGIDNDVVNLIGTGVGAALAAGFVGGL